MDENIGTPKTKFNAAIAKLERIDKQWSTIHAARLMHQWELYADALSNVRNELNEKMKKDQRNEGDKKEKKVLEIIQLYSKNKNNGVRKLSLDVNAITDYERFLRDIEHGSGMSIPDMDDDEGL